jgi:hypothetical protein
VCAAPKLPVNAARRLSGKRIAVLRDQRSRIHGLSDETYVGRIRLRRGLEDPARRDPRDHEALGKEAGLRALAGTERSYEQDIHHDGFLSSAAEPHRISRLGPTGTSEGERSDKNGVVSDASRLQRTGHGFFIPVQRAV